MKLLIDIFRFTMDALALINFVIITIFGFIMIIQMIREKK